MKKLYNPFFEQAFHCFGCSPENKYGLQLDFWEDDEGVLAYYNPQAHHEGYPNVIHGGIQATLLDEVAAWVIYVKLQTSGVTASMQVKFRKPVFTDKGEIIIKAKVKEVNRRIAQIEAWIEDIEKNRLCEAVLDYFIYPTQEAKEKYRYPGVEAFYKQVYRD